MCLSLRKVNGYLIRHPSLTLGLMWLFVALAVIPGAVITIFMPTMGYFKFLGVIIVPAILALYLRLVYSKIQDKRREERKAQKAEENQNRYQHKKKH